MTVLYCPLFLIYIFEEIELLCLTNFWLANPLKQHSDEHDENAQSAIFHPNLSQSSAFTDFVIPKLIERERGEKRTFIVSRL